MVSLNDGSILAFGCEDDTGRRYSDVWRLHIPSKLYSLNRYDQLLDPLSFPVWELVRCSVSEDVPTLRSCSSAVVCGVYLLIFGGWGQDSQCLDHCKPLHAEGGLTVLLARARAHAHEAIQLSYTVRSSIQQFYLEGGTRRTDLAISGSLIWTLGSWG
jgi:hypothetical protein